MYPIDPTADRLAHEIKVPTSEIHDILDVHRQITIDTSLRLGKVFGISERHFLKLQEYIELRNV